VDGPFPLSSSEQARFHRTLGVVTGVPHWQGPDGRPCAYEPYVREMEVWGRLFSKVIVCAPRGEGLLPRHQAAYATDNVEWRLVPYPLEANAGGPLRRAMRLPVLAQALRSLYQESDVILLRAPGHPSLLARLMSPALGGTTITKWAGLFDAFPGERLPSRLERWLAMRTTRPVLIYGPTPSEKTQFISFPPALMTNEELARAHSLGTSRRWEPPWQLLAVGRLLEVKNFMLALRGLAALRMRAPRLDWRFRLVGDGPEEAALRTYAADAGIGDRVELVGALPFRDLQHLYGRAHMVIMPGVKEGWPKIIAEAWAHGAVPVAAAAGIVPWIMASGDAGSTFDPDPESLSTTLERLLTDPDAMARASARGLSRARELSLETFGTRLERVLIETCGVQ